MGGLFGLVAKRIAMGFLTIIVISVLIFVGVEALPGDLATAILGQDGIDVVDEFKNETFSASFSLLGFRLFSPAYKPLCQLHNAVVRDTAGAIVLPSRSGFRLGKPWKMISSREFR